MDWHRVSLSLSNTRNENAKESFCPGPTKLSPTNDQSSSKWQKLTIMLPASPLLFSHTKFTTSELQTKYSSLTVIILGPPVSESSIKITSFIPPLVSNTNFVKRDLKAIHPGESNWNTPNRWTAVATTTLTAEIVLWVLFFHIPFYKVFEQPWRHFIFQNYEIFLKSHTHYPE